MDSRNHKHTEEMNSMKRFYEDQISTIKAQLDKQIELNKSLSKLELSSKQLEDIVQKIQQEKDKSMVNEKSNIENKEKFLKDWEDRLSDLDKNLIREKEMIMKMRSDFEMRELEKKKDTQEEKSRIEKEIIRMQELQNSLKVLEYNAKEKYERDRLEIIQKQNEMKNETDSLKSEYNNKLNEMEYQKKLFVEEKTYFEKYREEANKYYKLTQKSRS
jgi:hypothetical protein